MVTNVGKTMPQTSNDEWIIYTTYKNADDWGMVEDCFTHISYFFV